jgi:drug/metabolite transporter (DMT)-like permease
LLLLFIIIWGGNFVLAEVALRELAPISFSVARFLMGGLAMLTILYLQQRHLARREKAGIKLLPRLERGDWPRLLVVAVFGAMLAPWLGIEGLDLTHAGRASLWLALSPALSAALGYLFRTERIGRIGHIGLILAGLGTLGLALDGLDPERSYWLGDLFLVIAITHGQ